MARNSNKEWTPEEEKRLLELDAAGKSRVMIAAALRRTPGSISGRLPLLRLRQARESLDARLDGSPSTVREPSGSRAQ
jgi:hypothetical protein